MHGVDAKLLVLGVVQQKTLKAIQHRVALTVPSKSMVEGNYQANS